MRRRVAVAAGLAVVALAGCREVPAGYSVGYPGLVSGSRAEQLEPGRWRVTSTGPRCNMATFIGGTVVWENRNIPAGQSYTFRLAAGDTLAISGCGPVKWVGR